MFKHRAFIFAVGTRVSKPSQMEGDVKKAINSLRHGFLPRRKLVSRTYEQILEEDLESFGVRPFTRQRQLWLYGSVDFHVLSGLSSSLHFVCKGCRRCETGVMLFLLKTC